jgi:hypothetical protein
VVSDSLLYVTFFHPFTLCLCYTVSTWSRSRAGRLTSPTPVDKCSKFEQAIQVVRDAVGTLENTRWGFFASSKHLGDVLTVFAANNMCFKLLVWTKQTNKLALGRSWRHNCEYIVFCWARLRERDAERFVVPCPADPERYLTCFESPPVARPFMFEGDILNAYQKPISVTRRVLDYAAPDEGVVIDLTCRSGTTRVSFLLSPISC